MSKLVMIIKIGALLVLLHGLSVLGDLCKEKTGVASICVHIKKCQPSIDDLQKHISPKLCGFEGTAPMVCCVGSPATANHTSLTTSESHSSIAKPVTGDGGQPLPSGVTAKKTGRKAWDKCIKYQTSLLASEPPVRMDLCGRRQDMLIPTSNGSATPGEYPNLVLLGVGETAESAQWICGGSIISENFVLTSGSCTGSQETGQVTFVRLGVQNRSEVVDVTRTYRVKRIINHPENKPPHLHNDIALVETEHPFKLDSSTVPACLHVEEEVKDEAVVVGWVGKGFENEGLMQKTTLKKQTDSYCSSHFYEEEGHRIKVHQYNPQTQLCYIHHAKNFCRFQILDCVNAVNMTFQAPYISSPTPTFKLVLSFPA
ncbi:serine protease persephone-like isoform X2 [Pectinophora gossypiella]|uniref:serine protease persephone-like isoform X2 n=1 Tax=Pectinophora gossypiella TaxID=13191 RepID=UPI00214EBC9D|nr:serine protease persephone-like isoform X2 [Pectinophora gossypiella]